jgi:hypothetical protein
MEPAMIHDAREAEVISPLAGKPAPTSMLVDPSRLEREYYDRKPEMGDPTRHHARINMPGRADGNWRWRCTEEMLSTRAFEWLRDLTNTSGRSQGEFR